MPLRLERTFRLGWAGACVAAVACSVGSRASERPATALRSSQAAPIPSVAEPAHVAPDAAPPTSPDKPAPPPETPGPTPAVQEPAPYQRPVPAAELPPSAPARVAANLSPKACRAELARKKLPARRIGGATPGVATPVRPTGRFHGVRIVGPGRRSRFGVLDCRLLLVLDQMAKTIEPLGVTDVIVDNFYRPRAHLPGKKAKSQHAYGLAADVRGFVLADGTRLDIERDWNGAVGDPACGPNSTISDSSSNSMTLRNIVCEIVRAQIFHHVLTPGFNRAHRNHLHLDIKRGETRFSVR